MTDEEKNRSRAEELREQIAAVLRGEGPPARSPRDFIEREMREDAPDEEGGGEQEERPA